MGQRAFLHLLAANGMVVMSHEAAPMASMGEVGERACPLLAVAGEARAAGGPGESAERLHPAAGGAGERDAAPVGRPPRTARREGAPLEARGPGAAPPGEGGNSNAGAAAVRVSY